MSGQENPLFAIDFTQFPTRTQLVNTEAYQQLFNKAQEPGVNTHRKQAIYDYLIAAVKCNFVPSYFTRELIKSLKTASEAQSGKDGQREILKPNKVMVYFAGTGNPIGLKDSLFDERIINTLLDDEHNDTRPVVIAIPGVGINSENGSIGFSGKRAIRSGSGMADRVGMAHRAMNEAGFAEDASIEIMGHSRGAVQALALGKLHSDKNVRVFAHDPVLGSHVTPAAMNEVVDGKSTLSTVLNSNREINELFVMTCGDENRAEAFALYEGENAYLAKQRHVCEHPGFHNMGVFKGRSTTLNVDVMFSSWIGRLGVWLRSFRSNQDIPFVDQHRDTFKQHVYNKTQTLQNMFFDGKTRGAIGLVVQQFDEENKALRVYPELAKNPDYAVLQKPYKRTRFGLLPTVEETKVPEEDKSALLEEYKLLVRNDSKSEAEQIRQESIFAYLSRPKPLYDFWSRNFAKEVRAANPIIAAADLIASKKRRDALWTVLFLGATAGALCLTLFAQQLIVPILLVGIMAGGAAVCVKLALMGYQASRSQRVSRVEGDRQSLVLEHDALTTPATQLRRSTSPVELIQTGDDLESHGEVTPKNNCLLGCFGRR